MLKKILIIIGISLLHVTFTYSNTQVRESYKVKKIVLGKLNVKNNKIIKIPGEIDWGTVDWRRVTVDDSDNLYVLDAENKFILLFNAEGEFKHKITIPPHIKTPKYLEVSGNGNVFYIYDNFQFYLINRSGEIINNIAAEAEEVIRTGCKDKYIDRHSDFLFDKQLNVIAVNASEADTSFFEPRDSEGNFYGGAGLKYFSKFSKDNQIIWKKKIYGYSKINSILGIDGTDNVYLLAMLENSSKKGDQMVKIDKNGEFITSVDLSDAVPLLTGEEKKEWLAASSADFFDFYFYRVTCRGSVFVIYSYKQRPKKIYLQWLNKGEYFIYKFETWDK